MSDARYPPPKELAARMKREGLIPEKKSKLKSALISPVLVRLADRLGKTPEEVAEKIPEDTLVRLKSSMREDVDEEGRTVFEDPISVKRGIRAQFAGDQGRTHPVEQERDPEGKFTK